ncbi:MAG: TFIIB-type zinc ribbon-containing protein [Bacilli bacterium]|nr:TFIIB-type zinc ribbon-containing protein [Bacilli bacterium]
MGIKTEVLDNKCPHCGANIVLNPKTGNFKCEYCGIESSLEEIKKYNLRDNAAAKNEETTHIDNYNEYFTYTCQNCGAEIVADEQTTATFCIYCGNTAILKNKLSGKFNPKLIIPFKKTKEEAIQAFKSLNNHRPLIPNGFTDIKNIEKIRGIYIPFWFHDFYIEGGIVTRGTTVYNYTIGTTHYTKTTTYKIVRDGYVNYYSVPVDGSTRFDNALMNSIQPYDYKELVPYNHAYLSGFLAERYDVESNNTRKDVEPSILKEVKNLFINDAAMYNPSHLVKTNTLETKKHSVEYVLLPVYMVNVKYMGKMYTYAMNGQTGEFIGNIPVSKFKLITYTIALLISLFLFFLAISFLLYKVGL